MVKNLLLNNVHRHSLAFKVKVLLSGIDNSIARRKGVKVSVRAHDTDNTIERNVIPAKHNAGVFEFSESDVPVGHKFTACAKRIDTDDVAACKTGRNSPEHRIEEIHLDVTQEE
jgi:hypothetical protein